MNLFYIALVSLIFLVAIPYSSNASDIVSLQDSIDKSLKSNPRVIIAKKNFEIAQEQVNQALSGWRPDLSSNLSVMKPYIDGNNFGNSDGVIEKSFDFNITQSIYSGGRTISDTKRAELLVKVNESYLRLIENEVIFDTVTAYMSVVSGKELLDLARLSNNIINEQLRAVNERFLVGEVTITDVKHAEAKLAGSEADIVISSANFHSNIARYKNIVGEYKNDLEAVIDPIVCFSDLNIALDSAFVKSPLAEIARYNEVIEQYKIDLVYGELLPDIKLIASYDKTYDSAFAAGGNSTDKRIGLNMVVPIYRSGSIRSRLFQAEINKNKYKYETAKALREIENNVVAKWQSFEGARSEIIARIKQVEAAQFARNSMHEEAGFGNRSILDVLDLDQSLIDAKRSLILAKENEITSSYGLAVTVDCLR